jgi:hypothetical protein
VFRLFRRHLAEIAEAEAYERCHGDRSGYVKVVESVPAPPRPLVWWLRNPRPRITGEDIRVQLLARIQARRPPEEGAAVAEGGAAPAALSLEDDQALPGKDGGDAVDGDDPPPAREAVAAADRQPVRSVDA